MPAQSYLVRFAAMLMAMLLCSFAIADEQRPLSVSGIVQDRDGKPVPDAHVFVLDAKDEWSTTTDGRGAFELKQLPADGLFLFVAREGFRFHGEPLTQSDQSLVRQLTRLSEPADERLVGKDWTISRDERLKLVHRVFEPYLEQMLRSENDADKLRPLQLMAQIDPQRALELLEDKPLKQAQMGLAVRGKVMEQLARDDFDAAIEVAEGFESAYMRAFSCLRITQLSPSMAKPDRIALLSRAAADAKSIRNPAQRIAMLGLVAGALLDAGERTTAEKLLRETQGAAEKVANAAWAGFARGAFAKNLAQIDIEAALPLVTDLSDEGDRIRHLGNMAHELASIKPAEAERVLDMIERPSGSRQVIHERDNYAVRVCYRMAGKDLTRAKKIADSCQEKNLQAHAYGVIADALAKDDPVQATKYLRHAYDLLQGGIRDPQAVKVHAAQIAGCLLPTAERIDPTLVREMLWRTVSLRTGQDDSEQYRSWTDQQTSQLAAWLSRYDRETARMVLDRWHSSEKTSPGRGQFFVALALVDPQQAVEFAEAQDQDGIGSRGRFVVARTLAAEGVSRRRIPHRELGIWPIDVEDLDW